MRLPDPHHPWTLRLLLAALLGLYLVEIHHGLPNRDVVWGYDANPLLPLIAAKKIFLDGWNTGWHGQYPPFHSFFLLLFITPYMALQWLLGNLAGLRMEGGYPYGLEDFDTLFLHIAVITRLVSAAMALGAAYWTYRTACVLHSHRAGLYAACIVGFSPAVVYYVHTETVDVPLLFWLSGTLYCYVRALQGGERRHYLGLAVAAAAAMATSDYAYSALVLLPVPLVAALARRSCGSLAPSALARAALDRRHLAALAAFALAFALAQNWPWNFSGFASHVSLVAGWHDAGEVVYAHSGPTSALERSPRSLLILGFVLGWAGCAACAAGIACALVRERAMAAALAWPAAGHIILTLWPALAAVSFVERAYLPLLPVLALFGGVGLARLAALRVAVARPVAAVTVAAIALNGVAMAVALADDPRYRAESFLRRSAAAGATMELYGFRSELPRADRRWHATVVNIVPPPASDSRLTAQSLAPDAVAGRAPDWIVVSAAFAAAYVAERGPDVPRAAHAFLRRLESGEAGYVEAARPSPRLSGAFGFPSRLTPAVTVYSRQPANLPASATRQP